MAPWVILTQADGRYYATDTRNGILYELNEAARRVLDAMANTTEQPAVDRLAEKFPDVPRTEIEADVRDLVASLARLGLLRPNASISPSTQATLGHQGA